MASLARISKDNKKDEREDMRQINKESDGVSETGTKIESCKKRTNKLKEPVNRTKKKAGKGRVPKKKRTVKCSLYSVK